MAWNEPGGNGKDPWGNRNKNQGGPPDLDEIVKKMQDTLGDLFGGKGGGKSSNDNNGGNNSGNNDGNNGGNSNSEGPSWLALGGIAVIVLVIWSMFGVYIIQPAELGVITQFGRYKETTQSGLNWHWPYPIEQLQKVNVQEVRAITHRALMLTQDENIVVIELVIQYRVKDAKDYLFNVLDPDKTLYQATESTLREIVGTSNMDAVLTSERTRVAIDTKILIQEIVNRYGTGLKVTSVNMQNAQPPQEVQAAFADVIKAREDQERSKNKADAYANEIIEKAQGIAGKLRQEAKAYKAQVVERSTGETRRFLSVLKEYERAPQITRQRLYIESMESVFSNTSKVMLDVQSGNNLLVLPLDRLLGGAVNSTQKKVTPRIISNPSRPTPSEQRKRDNTRSRGGR
jgi:membrane protease subunit HflK